ncbi:YdgA family protein [Acidihalobacter ferrooxydans]|uniref:DUF945 domain-containing protein n=1 Tax=Acidihalobacter ferrooxydans TaxID=1765967 RepID=A0A1P8UI10_9GAMM|nr:DUF945 family protein [Acidihalobacter ferrooxydans]APZ43457.1 hypothetical protein BW247_10460 [Acidihalobacter ferrooxydans]
MKLGRILIGLIILALILVIGGSPWYMQRIVDRELVSGVQTINQQGQFTARYQRTADNWFGQRGTLTLVPLRPNLRKLYDTDPRPFTLHLNIAYGLIPFAAWGRDGVSFMPVGAVIDARIPGLAAQLRKAGSSYRLRDVVGLSGNSRVAFHLAPGKMVSTDGTRLSWGASELHFEQHGDRIDGAGKTGAFDAMRNTGGKPLLHIAPSTLSVHDLRSVDGQSAGRIAFDWGGLQLALPAKARRPSTAFEMGALHFGTDTRFADGIAIGKVTLTLASIRLRQPADATTVKFALKDMRLQSKMNPPQADYVDSSLDWTIAGIQAEGRHYSPLQLSLHLDHQYVPALLEAAKAMRTLQQQLNKQPNLPPQLLLPSMLSVLMPSLQQYIAHRPVLRITRLRLGMPGGVLDGSGEARIVPADGVTPSLVTVAQDIDAQVALQLPAPLAHQIAVQILKRRGVPADKLQQDATLMLDNLKQQGLLRSHSKGYALDVAYKNGAIEINGQVIRRR